MLNCLGEGEYQATLKHFLQVGGRVRLGGRVGGQADASRAGRAMTQLKLIGVGACRAGLPACHHAPVLVCACSHYSSMLSS